MENLVGFNYTAIFMIILLNGSIGSFFSSIVAAAVALRKPERKLRSSYHSLHLKLMNGWPFQLASNMDN